MWGNAFGFVQGVLYQAVGGSFSGTEQDPQTAFVTLLYDPDGGVRRTASFVPGFATIDLASWSSLHPNETQGANWSVRVRYVSGTNQWASGTTLNTWVAINAFRNWRFENTGVGITTAGVYGVDISSDAGVSVFSTTTLNISLEVFV